MRHRQYNLHHSRRHPVVFCSCRVSMRALHLILLSIFVLRFLHGVNTVWKSADDIESHATTMVSPIHGQFSIQTRNQQSPSILRSSKNGTNNRGSNSTSKPLAIIHVGPPKTATTTIQVRPSVQWGLSFLSIVNTSRSFPHVSTSTIQQCGLDRLSGKLARKDNFFYLGNACRVGKAVRMNNDVESLQLFQLIWELQNGDDINPQQQSSLLNQTKASLEEHRRQHHNIILSSEHFTSQVLHWHGDDRGIDDDIFFNRLKLLLEGFDVKVVIGYRHYFEWLSSIYYQHHHHDDRYLQWHDKHGGVMQHPSFHQFAKQHVDAWEQIREMATSNSIASNSDLTYIVHPTIQALRRLSQHFDDIVLLNLHDSEDKEDGGIELNTYNATTAAFSPLTQFVCDMLPSAHEACRALREKGTDYFLPSRLRISSNFYAERLVEEAYRRRLIVGGGGNGDYNRIDEQENHTKRVIKALPVHLTRYMLRRLGVYEDERYWICGDDGDNLWERLRVMSLFWMGLVIRDEKWGNYRLHAMGHWDEAALHHDKLFEQERSKGALDGGKFCDIDVGNMLGNTELSQQLFGEFWSGKGIGRNQVAPIAILLT